MVPVWDICALKQYAAWLHPDEMGMFLKIPSSTGTFCTKEGFKRFVNIGEDNFTPDCEKTWEIVQQTLFPETDNKSSAIDDCLIMYVHFGDNICFTNRHFNIDKDGTHPSGKSLLPKKRMD